MRLCHQPVIPHPKHAKEADKARELANAARLSGNGWQAAFWTRIAAEKDADAKGKYLTFDPLTKAKTP